MVVLGTGCTGNHVVDTRWRSYIRLPGMQYRPLRVGNPITLKYLDLAYE